MSTVGIIAALDRELAPLVRDWQTAPFSYGGHNYRAYEKSDMVAVAGGIGPGAARTVARAVVAQFKPRLLISAGLAGALSNTLKVGSVLTPNVIIDGSTGREYRCNAGGGVLVSAGEIADSKSKRKLAEEFRALAVDMEAASVAEVARNEGIGFHCVKAISDETDFLMPPLNQFVGPHGNFQTGRFTVWAVIRPHYWRRVMALSRNSRRASEALCGWLKQHVDRDFQSGGVAKIVVNS